MWQCFFERHGIGVMTDGGHHGKGEHDQRDMSMPAVPGAGFVVVEAEFVLGGLEAVLNSPAMTFHRDQLFPGRALGAPGGEEGQSPSAMLRRISNPRVHSPVRALLYSAASRSASSR